MDPQIILIGSIAVLVAVVVGGGALLFMGSDETKRANSRLEQVKAGRQAGAAKKVKQAGAATQKDRRKVLQQTLKELEDKQKQREAERAKLTLRERIEQAGLKMTPETFHLFSALAGLGAGGAALVFKQPIFLAVGLAFVFGFGVPRWVLGMLRGKRQKAFGEEFANALEVIVRGVKSGLPVNDCFRVVANESPGPVGEEFRLLIESSKVGMPLDQAMERMYRRMPIPEVNFFMVVLNIQQKTGGNLSEALGNLSTVIRARKLMRGKIQALSAEAKASAWIIGGLPFMVTLMMYVVSTDYIMLLFTEKLGHFLIMGALAWMAVGAFVMRQMISFKQ